METLCLTALGLERQRQRVGDDDALEFAVLDSRHGWTAQEAVRDQCHALLGPVLLEDLGGQREGAACVGNVVDEYGHLVGHTAHKDHAAHLVRHLALLVDDGQVNLQPIRDCGRAIAVCQACRREGGQTGEAYRLVPPASGDTITRSFRLNSRRMYSINVFSANSCMLVSSTEPSSSSGVD
ncbi:hypothetical protein CMQ_710 [Grosmannia clavigera kw1407]|uniref:Uncharacterized protein n=1 Tax=Grosmannia clavigera (strain kw1407 / UAMH 11150) TaxID=655863 RepID=F0XC31_GROCL|nr:uncharacterized protein CMQ_710 [Grosmannia clavigera kw1407]EFX03782.1 hypothetical protein CMQ_710 [Grosmannia clavigera kw1407]